MFQRLGFILFWAACLMGALILLWGLSQGAFAYLDTSIFVLALAGGAVLAGGAMSYLLGNR